MTTSAEFTEQEWDTVLEGPTSAGMVVATADRGGSFREAFAMAKVYAEARKEHGEFRQHGLRNVRDAESAAIAEVEAALGG